jgi:CheY-like chemotaxis protein
MIERMALSVLVVDDDPAFRDIAARILRAMGFEEITETASAAAAIAQAEARRPQAALVDVGLPDGDGIELARTLADLPWSPCVVLTSSDKDSAIAITSRPGESAVPFLAKEDLANGSLRGLLLGES